MDRFGSQVFAVLATLAFAVPMGVYIVTHGAVDSEANYVPPSLTTVECSADDGSATFKLHPRDLDQWHHDMDTLSDWRLGHADARCDYTHEY